MERPGTPGLPPRSAARRAPGVTPRPVLWFARPLSSGPASMPDLAHGGRRRPTRGIVPSEIHAPSCNSEYNLDKETRQVQPRTCLDPFEVVAAVRAGADVRH